MRPSSGRATLGADAELLLENSSRRTLVALNDHESRIGIRGGRLYLQPGFERHIGFRCAR